LITEANAARPDFDTREPALITRAQQGDRDAFGELYALHRDAIFSFVLQRVPYRHTAEDLTSEVFARAFCKLHTFSWNAKSIRAWLFTIARNAVADHFKKASTRRSTVVDDIWGISDLWSAPVEGPEDTTLSQLEVELLHQALARMTPRQRRVLELRFLQERTVPETAGALGISEGAAKTLTFRAMHSLREAYKGVAA